MTSQTTATSTYTVQRTSGVYPDGRIPERAWRNAGTARTPLGLWRVADRVLGLAHPTPTSTAAHVRILRDGEIMDLRMHRSDLAAYCAAELTRQGRPTADTDLFFGRNWAR